MEAHFLYQRMIMHGMQSNSGAAPHDEAIKDAPDTFCNAPEQSYEEFLSTFTHLSGANITGGCLSGSVGDNSASTLETDRRRNIYAEWERASQPSRINRAQQSQCALSTDLEELVLDGLVTGGRLGTGEVLSSHRPAKFDNYPSDMDEEKAARFTAQDVCVLPGEIEEDCPVYTPSSCHHTLLELSSTDMDHRTRTPQSAAKECKNERDEVVPFTLDDTFDYDYVVLSHKHPKLPS